MTVRVPDAVGEIVGFRAWRVRTSVLTPPLLLSVVYDGTVWAPDGWTMARCSVADLEMFGRTEDWGPPPHKTCGCGIYAARDRSHLASMGYNKHGGILAIGEVALAGDIIPGELGWRAERARPLRLWLPHEHWDLVAPLAAAYRVPVGLSNILKGRRTA